MADLVHQERLQPSLLDRLVDRRPDKQVESREAGVLTTSQLRKAVHRDLAWLMNARAHTKDEFIYDYPAVAKSVVNFGVPDRSGQADSRRAQDEFRRSLLDAIRTFEPRLTNITVRIPDLGDDQRDDSFHLEIAGDLWAQPAPEWLTIETDVDIERRQSSLDRHLDGDQLHGPEPEANAADDHDGADAEAADGTGGSDG